MNTSDFKRDDWLVIGLALVLAIDLIALPWFDIGIGVSDLSHGGRDERTPDGVSASWLFCSFWWSVSISRSSALPANTTLPNIGGSRTLTRWWLTVAAAVLIALKFLFTSTSVVRLRLLACCHSDRRAAIRDVEAQ